MNAIVHHLSNLIRIPSPSYLSNRPIIDYAFSALQHANWHSREITYWDAAGVEKINLIAAPRHQGLDDATAELALMCYTDTVPYSKEWQRALEPFVADGQLHGCGACDVKGFLACLLVAIAESEPSTLIDGLRLVLTADEEIGCVGAVHLVASGLFKPRRVVIGEPTSLHPLARERDIAWQKSSSSGKKHTVPIPREANRQSTARLASLPRLKNIARFLQKSSIRSFLRVLRR